MNPMYVLTNQDGDFILPRLLDKHLAATKWTSKEASDMHIDVGREFTSIRFRFETLKEAIAFRAKLERIRKAIVKAYTESIEKYPHMEDIYIDYLLHHKELKLKVVKVSFERCCEAFK